MPNRKRMTLSERDIPRYGDGNYSRHSLCL